MKPVSEEQLRAYFLGKLPASEADDLEMKCAADAGLSDLAQMVERELADDFLRGNLSAADAKLFETNYLITAARHQKLGIAEDLWKIVDERKAKGELRGLTVPPVSIWQTLFDKRRRFQLVLTCLVLLLVFGGIFCYSLILNVSKNEIAEVINVPPPPIQTPVVKNPDAINQNPKISAANSVVANKEFNKPLTQPLRTPRGAKPVSTPKIAEQNVPGLAVFAPLAGTLRDEGEQFMTIASNVKNVKFQLNLPEDAVKYQTYRAILKTADGDAIITLPNLKFFNFTLAADKLESRTYVIFLEGRNAPGDFESITEYTFRIRR